MQLVLFLWTGCGHCVKAKPTFSQLATKLKESNQVQAIAIDAAENSKAADIGKIQTLPTFKMYANGKLVADYDGDRSLENMMEFCEKHSKVKDELWS